MALESTLNTPMVRTGDLGGQASTAEASGRRAATSRTPDRPFPFLHARLKDGSLTARLAAIRLMANALDPLAQLDQQQQAQNLGGRHEGALIGT